jgi:hypothetical protein
MAFKLKSNILVIARESVSTRILHWSCQLEFLQEGGTESKRLQAYIFDGIVYY